MYLPGGSHVDQWWSICLACRRFWVQSHKTAKTSKQKTEEKENVYNKKSINFYYVTKWCIFHKLKYSGNSLKAVTTLDSLN